jgi:hypothetical protein
LDSDAFCTKKWERDPVAMMVANDLAILFDNFMGKNKATDLQQRIYNAFNTTVCDVQLTDDGHLQRNLGDDCWNVQVRNVHGFFHLTNLDLFRSDESILWSRSLIGDCFLCRFYDDQIAVSLPPIIFAPNKSWDMRRNGLNMGVFHNYFIDGKKNERVKGFKKYWNNHGHEFPEANGICLIEVGA